MSFLPSFSSLAAPATTATPSSSQLAFKPASLSYFTIFCPALKPPKQRDAATDSQQDAQAESQDAQDEDARETAREAAQILFYTSRARAALKDRMLRQIGVAKGMIEFCNMVSKPAGGAGNGKDESGPSKGRSWNVHSSKRRMILIEVENGVWVHASIDLPYTTSSAPPPTGAESRSKAAKEYHDALLPDAWLEESVRRAWRDWVLLNGCPAHILSQKAGRTGLERSLEKYFSVWAWSWDLELATNADVEHQSSLFTECIEGFPVVARAPRSKLAQLMQSQAAQRLGNGKQGLRDMAILSDTAILWPPTDAGCFDSEDEANVDELESSESKGTPPLMGPEIKAELLRRVVSHLTGLERERDLIRAASLASTSDGRKRGTSGAIRERGSSSKNTKLDMRNGLLSTGASRNRVVSSPNMQQRSTSASSYASSTTESTRWSNWGSVFSGLGKLGFRGNADSPARSESAVENDRQAEPGASDISIRTSDLGHTKAGAVSADRVVAPSTSSPVEAPIGSKVSRVGGAEEASSPLQQPQQKLAEGTKIQEASGKMWNGAELALRGIGASLKLASVSPPPSRDPPTDLSERAGVSKPVQEEEVSERDRFADASFDTEGADADASVVTKVSVLEPEVDVSELAEALGIDDDDAHASLNVSSTDTASLPNESVDSQLRIDTPAGPAQVHQHTQEIAAPVEHSGSDPISPVTDTRGSDAASIRTSASAKAFPSISVTSAAWYNTKALRSEAAVTTSSPKLSASERAVAEQRDTPDVFETSLGAVSVQSDHHDFELDGWGFEQPLPFQSFRCFVGESDIPVSYESLALLQEEPFQCTEYRVSFTTRRLLTLVLIEKVSSSTDSTLAVQGSDTAGVLEDAWQLLRRSQRILNDYDRVAKAKRADELSAAAAVRFLHLDGPTLTFQSSLGDQSEAKMDEDVQVVAEAHCVSAMELMRKHGVIETFSRSSNGKTWTASRQGKAWAHAKYAPPEEQRWNQTFMVLAGKKISIVDCDTELRKLANQYPSFGI